MLKGKNVILTGANRGIGYSMLKKFAMNGCNIWACARRESLEFEEKLDKLAQEYHVWIKPVYFELTSEEEIKQAMKDIIKERKNIDVLVNNAGVNYYGLFQMASVKKAKEIFDVNYFAPMIIMQYVLKVMTKQRSGCIINMSSIACLDTHAGDSIYGSAKSALTTLTKILASEVGTSGIRVNAIAPGPTDTDMIKEHITKLDENVVSNSVMGRLAAPDEIADVAIFLASEQASFINGQVIRVDGGAK